MPLTTITIGVALFIACIKAFLVAGYFMHLMSERRQERIQHARILEARRSQFLPPCGNGQLRGTLREFVHKREGPQPQSTV